MNDHPPAQQTIKWHLGQLDALRGIAILNVMLVHAVYWGPDHILPLRPALLLMVAFAGQRGVQLFFLVSAFTLYMSHSNRRHEARPTLIFILRRFFRITPMLYVSVALTYWLWPQAMGTMPHALLSMVYLSDFSPSTITSGAAGAWSVATEAAFYMTLPLLFRWVRTPIQALAPLCLCTAFAYFIAPRIANHAGAEGFWLYQSLPANYPTFLLGACGFFVWRKWLAPSDRLDAEDRRSISACLLAAFGVLYIYALPFSINKLTSESLILLLLVLALVAYPWRLLVNPVTVLLGKVSFSLYLLHFYVARYVERFLLVEAARHTWAGSAKFQFCAEYLLTLLLTLPLALAAWQWIEKPGIRLGRSVIQKLEHQRAAPDRFPALLSTRDTPDSQF